VSLSLSSAVQLLAEDEGTFQPPTVEHSFFFDKLGDGTVIASVKAMVLLVLGTLLIIWFLVASARKAAVVPGKFQFMGESIYAFVRNGIAIEVLG
jgi:F-type H+-transporting ATPase subunit a